MIIPTLLFLWMATIYFIGLVGVDRMVTGTIKPDVPEAQFKAYVFWHCIMNQAVAAMSTGLCFFIGFTPFRLVLIYATISWCWFGGGLDFVYFAMCGQMPNMEKIWHWMPFNPNTKQFAVFAATTFILLVAGWALELSEVIYV